MRAKGVSPCVLALLMSIQPCRRIAGGQIRLALTSLTIIVFDQAEQQLPSFFFARPLTFRFSPPTTKKIIVLF